MCRQLLSAILIYPALFVLMTGHASGNPWNGKVVVQAFWWNAQNENFQTDVDGTGGWYDYLAKLAPRLRDMGVDGIWVPVPTKGNNSRGGNGYDLFDPYDLGQKHQKGSTGTRWGNQDQFLRLIATAHAAGLEVYPDIVLNHFSGGELDSNAPGAEKHTTFRYHGFAAPGRWAKSWHDFHPNAHHGAGEDDWRKLEFGPDVCYRGRCCDHNCNLGGFYMRDNARSWLVWFRKQTDVDGFRFDAVKGFPPEVIEDLLFNAMDAGQPADQQRRYFAVAEHPANLNEQHLLDGWVAQVNGRAGTFDFALRDALSLLIARRGGFDMGSLPNFQQRDRFKTVPFINNHDTWRGYFPDSSGDNASDHTGDLKCAAELFPTIDPDDPLADVAYAATMAVDGSPCIFYEDLFINFDEATRTKADPTTHATRSYVENLIWCHQMLNFKDGPYRVPFQGSQDLLIIERGGKALIGLNDSNGELSQEIATQFPAGTRLHDYSGSTSEEMVVDGNGRVRLRVPAASYCVWGPAGIGGRFVGHRRRTTQEFQLDDDLGDSSSQSLGYGGKLVPDNLRTAGAVWAAKDTPVKIAVYCDHAADIELQVLKPKTADGSKSQVDGAYVQTGTAGPNEPLQLEFVAEAEGYIQPSAKLTDPTARSTRAYIKVEYEAPAASDKF